MNISDACKLAGIQQATWYKNLKQPHVLALFEAEKTAYIQEVEDMKDVLSSHALEVAQELLDKSSSDQVKARMVEFLRGGRSSGVTVNIQNNVKSGGYEYARPEQRIVEIEGTASEIANSPSTGHSN